MATFKDKKIIELMHQIEEYIKANEYESALTFIGLIITAIEEE